MTERKAHLSRVLQQVKEGEEIVITKRNIPVARIVPIPAAADEQMEALARQGLIKRGTGFSRIAALVPRSRNRKS
jgi:prevent-host-death family protein